MTTNINGVKRGAPQNNKPQQTTNNNQASSSLWDDVVDVYNDVTDSAEHAFLYGISKTAGFLPVGRELLDLSLMSPEDRDNEVRRQGGQVLDAKQSRAKLAELGMKEGSNCHTQPDQMDLPTMVMGKNSRMAQEVNKNEMMQKIVKDWAKNGAKDKAILPFNTANAGSYDLRMGIGYGQIVGLHLSADGKYAEGYIEDVYDYDEHYNKGKNEEAGILSKMKSKVTGILNKFAVDTQNSGKLKNYRTLIPIRVKIK